MATDHGAIDDAGQPDDEEVLPLLPKAPGPAKFRKTAVAIEFAKGPVFFKDQMGTLPGIDWTPRQKRNLARAVKRAHGGAHR